MDLDCPLTPEGRGRVARRFSHSAQRPIRAERAAGDSGVHLGQPKGKRVPELSLLLPVGVRLAESLGKEVFSPGGHGR